MRGFSSLRQSGLSAGILGIALLLAVAALAIPSSSLAESKERARDLMFEEEYALRPGGTLVVDVEDIDLEIRTGGGASSVQVFVSGKDREKAREYFEKIKFEARLDDNQLILKSHKKRHINIVGFWNAFRNTRARAIVTVPERIDVEIRTEDGDITMESISGNVLIRTEDGDIDISEISGASIKINTEDGDLRAKKLEGETVSVRSEDGDVAIDDLRCANIVIETEDGDLTIDRADGGRIELRSADGDMTVERADSDEMLVHTEDGDIVMTLSGKKFSGRCYDGDVSLTLLNAMEVAVKSEDGDVMLTVPTGSSADLDLSGAHVRLNSKISIQGNVSQKHITGTFNAGGPLIKIKVDDGTIIFREK